jgi:hypothetical protein
VVADEVREPAEQPGYSIRIRDFRINETAGLKIPLWLRFTDFAVLKGTRIAILYGDLAPAKLFARPLPADEGSHS